MHWKPTLRKPELASTNWRGFNTLQNCQWAELNLTSIVVKWVTDLRPSDFFLRLRWTAPQCLFLNTFWLSKVLNLSWCNYVNFCSSSIKWSFILIQTQDYLRFLLLYIWCMLTPTSKPAVHKYIRGGIKKQTIFSTHQFQMYKLTKAPKDPASKVNCSGMLSHSVAARWPFVLFTRLNFPLDKVVHRKPEGTLFTL